MVHSQSDFEIRFEWGETGLGNIGPHADIIVIVDVLSFSTSVSIAVSQGAKIYPYRGEKANAQRYTDEIGATLARSRNTNIPSLSPQSLKQLKQHDKLVLPSLNGSNLSLLFDNKIVFAGCLRNAKYVAEEINKLNNSILIIAAGERWVPEMTLRPAIEDLLGAGAIIKYLEGKKSPEAQLAEQYFLNTKLNLEEVMVNCSSGKELIEKGFKQDVILASELNVDHTIPRLHESEKFFYSARISNDI